MNTIQKLPIFYMVLLLFAGCNSSGEKNTAKGEADNNATQSEHAISSPNAEYSRLYALDNQCKMTADEVASLFGVSTEKVKEELANLNSTTGESYCNYSVETDEGSVTFSVITVKQSKEEVKKVTDQWISGEYEKRFLKMSSGNQYVWYHPNQNWLFLQHPDYANSIKIWVINKSKDVQKISLDNMGLKAVDFLEKKFKD